MISLKPTKEIEASHLQIIKEKETSLLHAAKRKEMTVSDIKCTGSSRQRLIDLGIFKGVKITITGSAPLGDPIIVEVGRSKIAIRKNDARCIEVVG